MDPLYPVVAVIGAAEITIIVVVIILFFGAAKIPELARALGRAKGEFEKGSRERHEERTIEDAEEARVRKAARELGIPTEGRALADVKADLRGKMG
ncbi:MAG TPA: twin-arginine translocase TatA/TatE family subunit [Candidatus Thermoplasmatota archaeon]|nr:twin-arginine translocase TatA/TatE family subunit [Candidatus Thermoplasmatota archaeon]